MLREFSGINRVETISKFIQELELIRDEFSLDAELIGKYSFVIEELFTNVIKYGYKGGQDEKEILHFVLEVTDDFYRLEINDFGQPFDPSTYEAKNLEKSLQEREIGGLGLHIVKNMFPDFTYKREDGKNTSTFIYRRK